MKNINFLSGAFAALLCLSLPTPAQDADAVARAAAQQEAEERYKRLNASVEELSAAQTSVQKKLAALNEELRSVSDELRKTASASSGAAGRDELRKLAESVAEIDKQRQADKEVIVGEIKKLAVLACTCSKSRPQAGTKPSTEPKANAELGTGVPDKGYEYTIREGDTLSGIVAAYRKDGIKVSIDQIKKANPKLDPNRMVVGRTITIPQSE